MCQWKKKKKIKKNSRIRIKASLYMTVLQEGEVVWIVH